MWELFCAAVVAISHVEIAWRYTQSSAWTPSHYHRWVLLAQSAMVLWIMLHGARAAQLALQPLKTEPAAASKAFVAALLRYAALYWALISLLFLIFAWLHTASGDGSGSLTTLQPYLYWLLPGWGGYAAMPGVREPGLVTAYSLWPLPVLATAYLLVPVIWAIRQPAVSLVALALVCGLAIAALVPSAPALAYGIVGLGFLAGLLSGVSAQHIAFPELARVFSPAAALSCTAMLLGLILWRAPASIYQTMPVLLLGVCIFWINGCLILTPGLDKRSQHKIPYGVSIICLHGPAIFLALLVN